ncbi:MAG: TrkH family potassium uptake protein [Oscillospiraceae bacterium]|jgi:trk system potassium uptake protein TrkH|nr:TrkH family potassium uptake protein [Oscillospiraceae bacterium]
MNYRLISQILGRVVALEAALMLIPVLVSLYHGESIGHFVVTILLAAVLALLLMRPKVRTRNFYAKEGFVTVAFSWISMALIGALPFVFSGQIPSFVDALFETVSGFTTTGASIVPKVEDLSYGILLWRCLTIWLGGMGVLVFVMFVVPLSEEHSMHIMRAEMPGPTVGKLVPRIRKTAMILYIIYTAMTIVMAILLRLGGMSWFDAVTHAMSTAGTGGFSNHGTSVAFFGSAYIEGVIGVFALLFGINFNLYYFLLIRHFRDAFCNEELRWYLGISAFAIVSIMVSLLVNGVYDNILTAFRYSGFQVASIITTTGHVTADFDLWPMYAKCMLLVLMVIGGCAGSTSGGIKVSRLMIMLKTVRNDVNHQIQPRAVHTVKVNGAVISRATQHTTLIFLSLYVIIVFISTLLVSLDHMDFTSTFTSVIACVGNVGPALGIAGPTGSYAGFSVLSKLVLTADMLLGRLEILPIVMLFCPSLWKRSF